MEKKRIYQLAKDFHVSSEALILMLKDLKYSVKSHMSTVDDNMLNAIKEQFEKQEDKALKDIQKKKKISEAITKKTVIEEKKVYPYKQRKKKKTANGISFDAEEKMVSVVKIGKKTKLKREYTEEKKIRSRSRKRRKKVDMEAVKDSFKKTLASINSDSKTKSKKSRSKISDKVSSLDDRQVVKVSEFVSTHELATQMGVPVNTLIAKCMELGMMVSINQRLDMDSIILLSNEFGYGVEKIDEFAEDMLKTRYEESNKNAKLLPRPPVVTVMGHVDHGKTTLLDYIRKTTVADAETGGITQHIGAYSVELRNGKKITFIDTPGHQAFTAMRARGAKVTDIVILVIAADDGVMPQKIEAIDHAKAANVSIVIAINKIDIHGADTEKIKADLTRHNILVEDWGGSYQCQEISAKKGTNTFELLDKVLLEAEMLELKADPSKKASGVVIETHIDKGRGAVATVLIQDGTLHIGDPFIAGMMAGNVRAMIDEHGNRIKSAWPSDPVQILGIHGLPKAGDTFYIVESEFEAREISHQRLVMKREQNFRRLKRVSLADLYDKIKDGTIKELNLIIKADVDGSVGAITDTFNQIIHDEVRINIIHSGVGSINENDILLAAASGAIIIGFHVRPTHQAKALALSEKVEIKLYDIIYEAVEEVKNALSGLLTPKITENISGTAEIRSVFKIPKVGNVAGTYVTSGNLRRGSNVRLLRDNIEIYKGKIISLRRFKDDVSEVSQGYECGLSIDKYNDIKVGDTLEVFELLEEARKI